MTEKNKKEIPKGQEKYLIKIINLTKQETNVKMFNLIDKEYLTSGNKFCEECKAEIICSRCPMLKAMINLKHEIKRRKE